MKNPADCWTAAYPEHPFGNLPLDGGWKFPLRRALMLFQSRTALSATSAPFGLLYLSYSPPRRRHQLSLQTPRTENRESLDC